MHCIGPGSAAHHHSASKTRVNALTVLRSVRGTHSPLSGGTTPRFYFVRRAPALTLGHDPSADSPSRPHPWHRSVAAPHRLGGDRHRRQPAEFRRLRLGGTAADETQPVAVDFDHPP